MEFKYSTINEAGEKREGTIDATSEDIAISSLQRRGLTVVNIKSVDDTGFLDKKFAPFNRVSNKDIVIMSRQIATLFEARVSALRIFRLLASESLKPNLKKTLSTIADDLQGGNTISRAISMHPETFSEFYVNMVKAGEETGKLDETFLYLADYLDRIYEITSKARSALVYPAFVIMTFIGVMVLMLTTVIPKLSTILIDSGQEIPLYTKVVIEVSDMFVNYGIFLLIFIVVGLFMIFRYSKTEKGKVGLDRAKLSIPYLGSLYQKLYLSRISDNLSTMLESGIPMLRAIEITADVSGSPIYKEILLQAHESIKGGSTVTQALSGYDDIPGILLQMIRVGEETGKLGHILQILATFYRREVQNAIDAMVSLIEPLLIIMLGLGVGFLLAAILIPIYDIATNVA